MANPEPGQQEMLTLKNFRYQFSIIRSIFIIVGNMAFRPTETTPITITYLFTNSSTS